MKHANRWLLIAALLAFLAPSAVVAAEGRDYTSSIEVGAAGKSVKDEANKVNEYSPLREDDRVNPYLKASLEGSSAANWLHGANYINLEGEVMSDEDAKVDLSLDVQRVFRFDARYGKFTHLLSHDRLNYMDATMKNEKQTVVGGANPAVYAEDLVPGKDFFMIHRETELDGAVVIPDLPNVTLKAGFRQEEREGTEQVFGISHCSACHVEGSAKKVDETTRDLTLGATGKFGMLTVDYEYLTRDFSDGSTDVYRDYLLAAKPEDGLGVADFAKARLLYDANNGDLLYSSTPESEKDSHTIKARVDMSSDTVFSASYITADVTSNKQDDVGVSLSRQQLSTDYDSYSLRASTRLGSWRLSGYGRREELDSSDNTLTFTFGLPVDTDGNGTSVVPTTTERATYQSEEARDVTTLGGNAVYRIGSGTSLRLGYEYQEIDREIDDAQDTETHTLKATLRFRPTSRLNSRISYTYQNIDEAFMNAHGNKGPEEQALYPFDEKRWYGTYFYSLREAEATNRPEDVHDIKASATWAPSARYSVTAYARYRTEENDLNYNTYKKESISPGVTVWWAPINNLNLTMAYNFDKQYTENQMCVGWYHG